MESICVPNHLGIIPDGNRRWAKSKSLNPWKGHDVGLKKIYEILRWCEDLGIRNITVYALSLENLSRPKQEVDFLLSLLKSELEKMLSGESDVHKKRIRVKILGNLSLLDKTLQEIIKKLEESTKEYSNYFLNLAIAYGGREELLSASRKIAGLVKKGELQIGDITETSFSKQLYAEVPDVDLIIRTSEKRVSGFLPWQSTYAELIFIEDRLFPDLTKEDFLNAINEFGKRTRRFGR